MEDALIDTRFAVVSPQELFIVYNYDLEPSPLYAVRHYTIHTIDNKEFSKVEIYASTDFNYYTVDGSEWVLDEQIPHLYGDVPVIEVVNNNDRTGDFEKVMTLIDAYNNLESDSMNDFDYFSDAYLFLKGASIDNDTAVDMKTNRLINVAEPDADASFLIKDIQDGALENFKSRLVNDIHKFLQLLVVYSCDFS